MQALCKPLPQGGDDPRDGAPQRNRALQVEHQYFGMLLITTNCYASANQTFASGAPKGFTLLVLDMHSTAHSKLTGYCSPLCLFCIGSVQGNSITACSCDYYWIIHHQYYILLLIILCFTTIITTSLLHNTTVVLESIRQYTTVVLRSILRGLY